ncbi:MAG TPA: bifunctional diguanylate cyclase/phosphodiesterase [Candidatus Binatia bacterium]|nr:bifunctional diguanylate cyclase/phosphodiesterase [Candidatus Binatia bacterium]
MVDIAEMLDQHARRGFRGLRFPPELEQRFLAEHARAAIVQRMVLLLAGAVLVAASPFFDSLLLSPPEEYLDVARRVEFGVILPALLLAFACSADKRLHRFADTSALIALLAGVGGWEYLRAVGLDYDFDAPMIVVGILLLGTLAFAGLFFWTLAPVGVLGIVLIACAEVWVRGPTEATLYNILALCALALVTALSRYVQEYYQRAAWLRREATQQQATAARSPLHDVLTGLGNRRRQEEALRLAIGRNATSGRLVALLLLDLDNFRGVNEGLGHQAGDALLTEVAARLRRAAPPQALLCRYGGDEFTLVLDGLDPRNADAELRQVALAVQKALREPHYREGDVVYLTGSIGIATHPIHGDDPEQLAASAEAAMYRAKKLGRNRIEGAEASARADARRELSTAAQIREGLATGQFEPYYQPIVDLARGQVAGVEALLRWRHPVRGVLGPDQFLPQSEAAGLIEELGAACLRQAHEFAAHLRRQARPLPVEVNLSARELRGGRLPALLADLRARIHLPPGTIGFEITESSMMVDPEECAHTLQTFRDLGYRLAMDDFGTGFSALGYLQKLPVHRIKIDRGFVARLSSPQARTVIGATTALGTNLGLEIVAEGVETGEQMQQLRDLGCTLQQGHYFAAAMPVRELEAWLEKPLLLA